VVELLVRRGDEVVALDLEEAHRRTCLPATVRIIAGSLVDPGAVRAAISGSEVVYHLGGLLPGNPASELFRVNVGGTRNVVAAAAQAQARRIVFLSSTAVYAPVPRSWWPITEGYPLRPPDTRSAPYTRTKVIAERLAASALRECVILRPSKVYSAELPFVASLVQALRTQDFPAVAMGLVHRSMQWVHVDDAARAALAAGTGPTPRAVCNVAGPELFDIERLRAVVRAQDGSMVPSPEVRPLPFDLRRAEALLGYVPRVTLAAALATAERSPTGSALPPARDGSELARSRHR
jgi:nucleoside-diphosphate-sugar epimerase